MSLPARLRPALSRPPTRGGSVWRALGVALAVVVVLGGGLFAGYWYLQRRTLAWQVKRGLALLADADTARQRRAALDRWENETRTAWESRSDELITHLYKDCPLEDPRVRLLLARVAGADYGERRADWQRWYENRRRLRAGQPPQVSRSEAIKLEPRWEASVGLTAWFSTIIPLDGKIYVASLGADFNDPQDVADGVVRVDGASGTAELIFSPPARPGRGPRDVVGIAAGENRLYVACLNGTVFCIDPDGEARWEMHVGSPIIGPPLSVDINGDDISDVIVATRAGKVVALNGQTGRTAWVASVAQPPAGADLLGATLALGNPLAGQGPELVVTMPTGEIEVLTVRTGKSRWRHKLELGTLAGAVCCGGQPAAAGPPAYVADQGARVWALMTSGQSLQAVPWGALALRREETIAAGLRTLRGAPDAAPLLLACPVGDAAREGSGVCALAPEGVQWRLPIDGAVWGTPAVADLNGDHQMEVVVTSVAPDAAGRSRGVVTIVSEAGHCLHRLVLDAPIECSPVVADVDGDNHLEVLIADQAGVLHCYGTGRYGPVWWGLAAGDSHNTRNAANAFDFGQRPFHYQWRWRPEDEAK